jgi:hypothetical protein
MLYSKSNLAKKWKIAATTKALTEHLTRVGQTAPNSDNSNTFEQITLRAKRTVHVE